LHRKGSKVRKTMKLINFCQKILSRNCKSDLNYEEAMEIVKKQKAIIIDVRNPEEYMKKHILNAINIPLYEIEKVENEIINKDAIILMYCQTGKRSNIAKQILKQNGYKNVYTISK
jgi:rhodanese-related sulfurtransferase